MTHGFRRREIVHDGVRLSFLDNEAVGPAVVMLHGLAGTGDEFVPTASAVGGPFRFILPDLRGHGASTRRPADLSRAAFVSDVAALIGQVSPGRPVALAGQSMGGNYFRSWPVPFASAAAAREFLGDDALSRSWAGHLEPAEGGGLVPAFDADTMEAIMTGVSVPQWERWRAIEMPVTVVFAPKGMVTPDEQAEFVAARPGTRPVVLHSGSHDAHLDATEEWAEVLRQALENPS